MLIGIAYDLGDEFTPEYEDDEVEVARVSLRSTIGDVISVRARRRKKFITYNIVTSMEPSSRFAPRGVQDL
jgi:hypothetical protein